MILVSFIIPVYNTPLDLLERGLNRFIQYANEYYETIIIDDGSTNGAEKICDRYKELNHRFKVIHQDNSGVSVARNVGIHSASGKYIVFVDPDDLINEEAFNTELYSDEKADLVLFDYIREFSNGEKNNVIFGTSNIVYDELIKNVLFDQNIYGDYYAGAIWAKAFKRSFLIDNHLEFNPSLRKAQDRVFMLSVYDNTECIKYIPIKSYNYYENMESICNAYKPGSYIRSESFLSAVDSFIVKNNRIDKVLKNRILSKVYMNVFFEMVYLDFFNLNNKESLRCRLKKAKYEYVKLNIHDKLCFSSTKDYGSKIEKIKFILIRNRWLLLLNNLVRYRQYKRQK